MSVIPADLETESVMKARPGEMTIPEASARFGVPSDTLKTAARRNDIPCRREYDGKRHMTFLKPDDVLHFKANIWQPHVGRPRGRPRQREELNNPQDIRLNRVAEPEGENTTVEQELSVPTLMEVSVPTPDPLPSWLPNNVGVVQIGDVFFLNLLYTCVPIGEIVRIDWDARTAGVADNAVSVFTKQHMDGYLLTGKYADTLRSVFNVQKVKAVNT